MNSIIPFTKRKQNLLNNRVAIRRGEVAFRFRKVERTGRVCGARRPSRLARLARLPHIADSVIRDSLLKGKS